jgi:hypothetical protein
VRTVFWDDFHSNFSGQDQALNIPPQEGNLIPDDGFNLMYRKKDFVSQGNDFMGCEVITKSLL